MRIFIGLLLILFSFNLAWMGFDQNDAYFLKTAQEYEEGVEEGTFIWTQGEAAIEAAEFCPESDDEYCLYSQVLEETRETEFENWEEASNVEQWAEIRVGGLFIDAESALFIDKEVNKKEERPFSRTTVSQLPVQDELLIAGPLKDRAIMTTKESSLLIVSPMAYEDTLNWMVERDHQIRQFYCFIGMITWILGWIVLASPFVSPFRKILRVVPLIGAYADVTYSVFVYGVIAVAGSIVWILTSAILKLIFWLF